MKTNSKRSAQSTPSIPSMATAQARPRGARLGDTCSFARFFLTAACVRRRRGSHSGDFKLACWPSVWPWGGPHVRSRGENANLLFWPGTCSPPNRGRRSGPGTLAHLPRRGGGPACRRAVAAAAAWVSVDCRSRAPPQKPRLARAGADERHRAPKHGAGPVSNAAPLGLASHRPRQPRGLRTPRRADRCADPRPRLRGSRRLGGALRLVDGARPPRRGRRSLGSP